MALPVSRSSQETEDNRVYPQNDKEYLTEWPPVDEENESEKLARRKRAKIDREERVTVSVGRQRRENCWPAEESERVLWARPALARWWRKTQQKQDIKTLPKSDNPNTLLRYVARYV